MDETYPLKTIKKPLTLEPVKTKEYEGVYEISPTFKISITVQGSSLFLKATDQPKLSLYAEDTDKFFLKAVEAKVQFSRNAYGKIEKLTINQNGIEQVGKKIQ